MSLLHDLINSDVQQQAIYVSPDGVKGADDFCENCPVYDKSDSFSTKSIAFDPNCESSDKICHSNLTLDWGINEIGHSAFILGSSNSLVLKMIVENRGENAYQTRVGVVLPYYLTFLKVDSHCNVQNASVISCNVANPLENNDQVIF